MMNTYGRTEFFKANTKIQIQEKKYKKGIS